MVTIQKKHVRKIENMRPTHLFSDKITEKQINCQSFKKEIQGSLQARKHWRTVPAVIL